MSCHGINQTDVTLYNIAVFAICMALTAMFGMYGIAEKAIPPSVFTFLAEAIFYEIAIVLFCYGCIAFILAFNGPLAVANLRTFFYVFLLFVFAAWATTFIGMRSFDAYVVAAICIVSYASTGTFLVAKWLKVALTP